MENETENQTKRLNDFYPKAYETVKRFTKNPMIDDIEKFLWKKQQ